jgi:hypothetical protein
VPVLIDVELVKGSHAIGMRQGFADAFTTSFKQQPSIAIIVAWPTIVVTIAARIAIARDTVTTIVSKSVVGYEMLAFTIAKCVESDDPKVLFLAFSEIDLIIIQNPFSN